jgi:ubiquinone/menaquinone biosynthesis C-methylase UbiE
MSHETLAKTFDGWAAEGRDGSMEREHGDVVRQVLDRLAIRPGERILDLGCGNGWATRLLARAAPGVSAVGIDVSPAMVERAEALHSFTIRARYEVAPFERLPLAEASFDRVFSMEALYYAVDLDRALGEAFRVLAPGGSLEVVVDYYEESAATAQWSCCTGVAMHRLSEAGWRQAFERAGFAGVRLARVVDSRGPGDPASFAPSVCYPDWETRRAVHAAGSLWIHGEKPAGPVA